MEIGRWGVDGRKYSMGNKNGNLLDGDVMDEIFVVPRSHQCKLHWWLRGTTNISAASTHYSKLPFLFTDSVTQEPENFHFFST